MTGSVKCSCRWSTYSIQRPSVVPLTATKSNMARCWTISHRPTPPACGHTGTPNLAASSRIARFSLMPPTRQASIWTTSIASACSSCLKITRFCTCSPVATRTGATAVADRAVAEHVVGRGRLLDPVRVELGQPLASSSMAWSTPQRWLASTAMRTSCPAAPGRARAGGCRPRVGADLELDHGEAVGDRLAGPGARSSRRRSRANPARSCRRAGRRPGAVPSAPLAVRADASRSSASSGGGRRRCR